jgi:uncharacterized phiE125 gp8 family phage protein
MSLTITGAPGVEPVSLTVAKAQCRVSHDREDELIGEYIVAAREYCEKFQGRAYVEREYTLFVPFATELELPMPPLVSVDSVTLTQDGDETTLAADTDYRVDSTGPVAVLILEDTVSVSGEVNTLTVVYTAGYGETAEVVPGTFRQAMRMLISHWYDTRGLSLEPGQVGGEVAFAVKALLTQERVNWSF